LPYSGVVVPPAQVLSEQAAAASGRGEGPPLLPPTSQRRLMRILRELDVNALEKLLLWESYLREEAWEGRDSPRVRRLLRRVHAALKALDEQAVRGTTVQARVFCCGNMPDLPSGLGCCYVLRTRALALCCGCGTLGDVLVIYVQLGLQKALCVLKGRNTTCSRAASRIACCWIKLRNTTCSRAGSTYRMLLDLTLLVACCCCCCCQAAQGQATPYADYPDLPDEVPGYQRVDKDMACAHLDAEVVGRQFHRGSGDRHYVRMDSYPSFEGYSLQVRGGGLRRVAGVGALLMLNVGQRCLCVEDVGACQLANRCGWLVGVILKTPYNKGLLTVSLIVADLLLLLLLLLLQEFDSIEEGELSTLSRLAAEREDNMMWKEFRERLLHNIGLVSAAGASRL
jgi:hypothetical protein